LLSPFLHEDLFIFPISELVWQHTRNIIYYRVPSSAIGAGHQPFIYLIFFFKDIEFQRIVLADWASQYVKELSPHIFSPMKNDSKSLLSLEP
jgi:hypothetical protein